MRFSIMQHALSNTEYGDLISQLPATAGEADCQLKYTDQGVL